MYPGITRWTLRWNPIMSWGKRNYDTAATWPERELNELFGINFEGLDTSKRLFLPEDMLETQGRGQIMVTPLSELVEKNRKEEA